jgi:hypothetical protein
MTRHLFLNAFLTIGIVLAALPGRLRPACQRSEGKSNDLPCTATHGRNSTEAGRPH